MYKSVATAAKENNISISAINNACKGKVQSSAGYQWRLYKKERIAAYSRPYTIKGTHISPRHRDTKKVYQYSLDGQYLQEYTGIALQWHPTKNGDITPDVISYGSKKRVWWRDSFGHEWSCSVYSRTSGSGCPYCSGRLPIKGQTDLATTNPALASEWHPTKNLPLMPDEIKEHSNKKVWWICSQGHEYILKGSAKRGLSSKRGFEKK